MNSAGTRLLASSPSICSRGSQPPAQPPLVPSPSLCTCMRDNQCPSTSIDSCLSQTLTSSCRGKHDPYKKRHRRQLVLREKHRTPLVCIFRLFAVHGSLTQHRFGWPSLSCYSSSSRSHSSNRSQNGSFIGYIPKPSKWLKYPSCYELESCMVDACM